jgi:uncharacterized protein YdeI (YjbR/CyaY-like superfamily)
VTGSAFEKAPRLAPRSRAEWRRWLARHHAESSGVWLVLPKKASGLPGPTYDESVEEALCFGWIDSRTRPLDEQRRLQWYCPRRPGSIWSAVNKTRVARLLEAGLMAPAGLAKIEAAQADGSWDVLDRVDALEMPAALAAGLRAVPGAEAGFAALAPSVRRPLLYWVLSAKRPQTRASRIAAVAEAAAEGRAPSPPY